jgi:hypothetical protein
MNEYVLIHIGKCGGNTVHTILKKYKYSIIHKHIKPVNFNPIRKYIILLRNPISRIISAFNWRYHNVCITKKQKNRFTGEKQLLKKYKTINALAEDIYHHDGSININFKEKEFYIHHIYEDINFYIGNFLDNCKVENIHGVIMIETIKEDIQRLFSIDDNLPHKLKNESYDINLSTLGYSNLKKYLHKDYECIEKMYNMNIITKKQYDILSV